MPLRRLGTGYLTITNNIFHNWDYGIHTTDANSEVGVVSNNLFHLVTSAQEVVGETDANKVTGIRCSTPRPRQPPCLQAPARVAGHRCRHLHHQHRVALRPGRRIAYIDLSGPSRPQGAAPDIGLYEGTGYTPNPTGEFDTLTNTVSGNTVIVKNSKWKLVWDMARGGGITGFYNMTGDTTANLVGTNTLLFDVRIDAYLASTQTSNTIAPAFIERTRARSVVRQRLALSASLDLNVYYTVYASGHVYVQSEIANLSAPAPWTWTWSSTSSRWAPPTPSPRPPAAWPASATRTATDT